MYTVLSCKIHPVTKTLLTTATHKASQSDAEALLAFLRSGVETHHNARNQAVLLGVVEQPRAGLPCRVHSHFTYGTTDEFEGKAEEALLDAAWQHLQGGVKA